jgi:PAS domain S-box-containing protein
MRNLLSFKFILFILYFTVSYLCFYILGSRAIYYAGTIFDETQISFLLPLICSALLTALAFGIYKIKSHKNKLLKVISHTEGAKILSFVEEICSLGYWKVDLENNKLFWSPEIYKIHGVTPKEYTPELTSALKFYHPEDIDIASEYVNQSISHKIPFHFELRIIRPNGEIRYVEGKGNPTFSDNNFDKVTGLIGVFQDITDKKENEFLLTKNKNFQENIYYIATNEHLNKEDKIRELLSFANSEFNICLSSIVKKNKSTFSTLFETSNENKDLIVKITKDPHLSKIYIKDRNQFFAVKDTSAVKHKSFHELDKLGIKSFIAFPLYIDSIPCGYYICYHKTILSNKYLQKEEALLKVTSQWISTFLTEIYNENNLQLAIDKAKKASQSKSDFLANMSHEIRTPLNGIIGISNILHKTNLSTEQKKYMNLINSSSETLVSLLSDILDFEKIEANKVTLEKIPFNMKALISQITDVMITPAQAKNIKISYEYPDDCPESFIGDPCRLRQIILNLASNAIKFTEEGQVDINVKIKNKTKKTAQINIYVKDTGIGIDKKNRKMIFSEFSQEDFSISRKFGGTGLGLAISKKLSKLMKGDINVISKKGQGSTFIVSIELEKDLNKVLPKSQKAIQKINLKGKKILLVEDNAVNTIVATKILEQYGAKIDTSENGKIAINKFKTNKYDLVLMDCSMPEMDGFEATEKIRLFEKENKTSQKKKTPIIALTAHVTSDNYQRSMNSGMDDYLNKPININELETKLSEWVIA